LIECWGYKMAAPQHGENILNASSDFAPVWVARAYESLNLDVCDVVVDSWGYLL